MPAVYSTVSLRSRSELGHYARAQRIETVVAAVGDRERVIAGVDCGFGTFVGWEWVTEDVVWAKLATLRAGAEIASTRLWGRKVA